MEKRFLFILILFIVQFSYTEEFAYPIAQIDEDSIVCAYQKSLSDIELYRYSLIPDNYYRELYWRYLPLNLKVLSDKSGFSFIDSDRLRIKKFYKRSPASVDFEIPIWSLGGINWIDKEKCIVSGRQEKNLNIYLGDVYNLNLDKIASFKKYDCFSPSYLNNAVYFIKRSIVDRECLIASYSIKDKSNNVLLNCDYKQIVHLQMIDDNQGFFVEHMPYIGEQNKFIKFICYKFEKKGNHWNSEKIFTFKVLKKYLLGKSRILESFKIFMPRVKKTRLYFASAKQNNLNECHSSIFTYDLISHKLSILVDGNPKSYFFAPLAIEGKIFYGEALKEDVVNHKFKPNVQSLSSE